MPEISLFYGIRVTMYYDDHNPPHFHAEYNGNKAIIEIDHARVIKGALTSRQPLSHAVPFLVGYKMYFSGF